ncbi:MAG: glycosyltransferase, partial [Syntrophothermus sp.]
TDLAIRVRQRHPAGTWLYQPRARVQHSVPGERAALGYFVRRCFEEGVGKANLSRYVGSEEGLASERAYVARVLPRGVAHAVHQALRGDPAGAARAGAIVLGLLVTGAGFSLTSAKNALSGSKPEHRQMTRRKRPEPPSPEFSPVRVHDIEIGEPLAPLLPGRTGSGQPFGSCLCLIRLHGRPLGTIEVPLPAAGVPAERLAELVQTALGDRIVDHLHADGLEPQPLGVAGLPGPETPLCVAVRERMLADPPRISVVIVTRGRPQRVLRTMLSILSCRYPRDRCEVIIVDTPEDGQPPLDFSAEPSIPADANVRVVVEPQRGISLGRNRGLREATGEIVVFADDDVDVDANWLPNLIAGFELGDRVAAVSGPTLPATIETPTERWFEGFGGLQRGYETRVYSLDHRPAEQPLFPFVPGALGSGRSMAFRREAFLRLGGFDPALGPPTPTLAGEDIEALLRFVLLGRQVVHEPAALVWHAHPRDYAMLRRRMWGYGLGLSACITKSVVAEPKLLPLLVRKLPRGIAFAVSPHSEKNRRRQGDYPRELVRLEAAGLLVGPLAYARSRIQRRRRGGAPDAVRG